jgi:tryptophan-rich sensory protein
MNIKRLILAIIAGWVVIFATDFLIHNLWLGPVYEATKPLWRPEGEMHTHICWMFLAQFLIVATFVIVWAKGFAGGSMGAAVTFGLLMGVFQQTWAIILFVVLPMPGELAVKWFVGGLVQAVLLGIVTSLVYKPAPSSAP